MTAAVGWAACDPETRKKFKALQASCGDVREREAATVWRALPLDVRALLLLSAGIDAGGDVDPFDMARKSWQEYPPHERTAIVAAGRSMRAALAGAGRLLDWA